MLRVKNLLENTTVFYLIKPLECLISLEILCTALWSASFPILFFLADNFSSY
jgi:hypothetical protein